MAVFKVSRTLFGTDRDVLLLNVYVPPSGSPYYESADDTNSIDFIERCFLETLGNVC